MFDGAQGNHDLFARLYRVLPAFARENKTESVDRNGIAEFGAGASQPEFIVHGRFSRIERRVESDSHPVEILHIVGIVAEREILVIVIIRFPVGSLRFVKINLFQNDRATLRSLNLEIVRPGRLTVFIQHEIPGGMQELADSAHIGHFADNHAVISVFGVDPGFTLRIRFGSIRISDLRIAHSHLEPRLVERCQLSGQINGDQHLPVAMEQFAVFHILEAAAQQKGRRQRHQII